MAAPALGTAPVLSTPDTHIFEDPTPAVDTSKLPRLSDEQVTLTYEIERTVREIREGRWKRIALQFPDQMLVDAPRVYEGLTRRLKEAKKVHQRKNAESEAHNDIEQDLAPKLGEMSIQEQEDTTERLYILADTSYGACCVDEVAAEHVDADVVVHYGRSCLSPPSRLPVIYVFTERELDMDAVSEAFHQTYPNKEERVILMADIPYSHHIGALHTRLSSEGYTNVYATEVVHDPSATLPNRRILDIPEELETDQLRDCQLFHVSEPPQSLLLTLSSRVAAIHIYPTDALKPTALPASTSMTLRRRYALLTSLSTVSVFGILINTLSVKNYMHILSHVKEQIAAAGKKSYTFVVGKVNAAKVANFSEVGGWVVIGCWESSLIESADFWKPIVTPFELGLALQGDEQRVWTGEWTGDFQAVLAEEEKAVHATANGVDRLGGDKAHEAVNGDDEYDSEEESEPPEFDLRTGRYVSHSRPMRASAAKESKQQVENGDPASTALTRRANGDLAQVGGVVSPGAEYLRSKRTWQGLGSDYRAEDNETGPDRAARMEEGRSGIARGYHVGKDNTVH